MARVIITPANQKTRIEKLVKRLNDLKTIDFNSMIKQPSEKSWSALEVIEHMIMAQKVYESKIESALEKLPSSDSKISSITASGIPSFLIKRFPPKEGKISFKMKTMKVFQPILNVELLKTEDLQKRIESFESSLNQLKGWVSTYPNVEVESVKFNSAVGALVKFNVAEACEFILCHNERHMKQIDNTLQKIKK